MRYGFFFFFFRHSFPKPGKRRPYLIGKNLDFNRYFQKDVSQDDIFTRLGIGKFNG